MFVELKDRSEVQVLNRLKGLGLVKNPIAGLFIGLFERLDEGEVEVVPFGLVDLAAVVVVTMVEHGGNFVTSKIEIFESTLEILILCKPVLVLVGKLERQFIVHWVF